MLLLAGVLLTLWPRQATAQANAVTWDITPGFNGAYRAGAWFPVTVTLSNSGPDLRGTLELRFRGAQSSTFSQTVELPHNARKQLVLPVASQDMQTGQLSADLTLRSDGAVVRRERINLNGFDSFVKVVGVISDHSGALPELANMSTPEMGNGALVRFTSAGLPERAELLQTFSVLFVHAADTSVWSAGQRAALQSWIISGGQLVVGGDPQVARGLSDLLPATFEEAGDQSSLGGLGDASGWRVRADAPTVSVLRLTPAPGAQVVLRDDNDLPLVVRRWSGLGLTVMTSFGLETVREAGDAAAFWPNVLRLNIGQNWGAVALRSSGRQVLEAALQLPGLQLPSPLALLGFLLLYILIVGPLNYLLLRRLQRREWAYLTVPLVVLLFSAGAYLWGTLGRGTSPTITELTVVQVLPEGTRGQATTFLALFSPARRSYSVEAQPEALVSNLEQPWQNTEGALDIVFGEQAVSVPEVLVDVGGVRTLSAEHSVAVPQLEISRAVGNQVTIRNRGDQQIEQLALVNGAGLVQALPALEPGQERAVVFNTNGTTSFGMGANDTLDRDRVFEQLSSVLFPAASGGFDPRVEDVNGEMTVIDPAEGQEGPSRVLPDPAQELYVFGWQSQPTLAVTLNGQQTTSTGEALYIWSVGKEQ